MAYWPLPTGSVRSLSTMRATSGVATGVTVTASGTAHTKGAWAEIIASTATAIQGMVLHGTIIVGTAATDTAMLMDIGIGAAGSEVVVVPNLNVGAFDFENGVAFLIIPLALPAGTRIAARIQAKVVSDTFGLGIDTFGGNAFSGVGLVGAAVDTIGADLVNSRGTSMTTGATASTFGAWAQLAAATTNSYRAVWLTAGQGGDTVANHGITFELGVGAAGAEQVILSVPGNITASEQMEHRNATAAPVPLAIPVAAGQRLAVRGRSNVASRLFDVCAHGLRG